MSSLVGVEVPTMFDTQQQFDDRLYAASVTDITIPYPDPDAQMYYSEERLQNITKDLTAVFVGQMPQNGPSVFRPSLWVVLLTFVVTQRSTLCARPVHQLQHPRGSRNGNLVRSPRSRRYTIAEESACPRDLWVGRDIASTGFVSDFPL